MNLHQRSITLACVAVFLNLAGVAGMVLSNNDFLMSAGSDAPNLIVGPSSVAQIAGAGLLLLLTAAAYRASSLGRVFLVAAWAICAIALNHRIVVDVTLGELRDVYFLMPVQRMPLGPFEGGFESLRESEGALTFRLATAMGGMTVWRGVPPAYLTFTGQGR